jgi:copper(I)-binding protein
VSSSGVISALYLTLQNSTGAAVQLTGVETEVARVVELHQTANQNGLMQMRPVESVEVPAGGEVLFKPGGFHIMLIDINRPLEPGDEVAVTLSFNTGERLELPAVSVRES